MLQLLCRNLLFVATVGAVYVPEGFYHATINLDDTVGVVGQNLTHGPITAIGKAVQAARTAPSPEEGLAAYLKVRDNYGLMR